MAHLQYMPGDPRLVDQLVYELKSKGIFDQLRKECIADVDTRPAYQNLRQRVESSVTTFLSHQCWKQDLNKNQLREKLRKHILDGNYLEQGVERIVDQVVNPKIASVFIPQVEDLVYNYLGITRQTSTTTTTETIVENTSINLLSTDLEVVSPGSVKSNDEKLDNVEMDCKEESMDVDPDIAETKIEEPLISAESEKDKEKPTIEDVVAPVASESTRDSDISIDKSTIPLPDEIKPEDISPPENSPPKLDLKKIELPKTPDEYAHLPQNPTEIPLPTERPIENENCFKPINPTSDNDDSSSDSSLRRNMSPLTPVQNFNTENSCDAQQAFENDSDAKLDDNKEPSSFRFAIEAKTSELDSVDKNKTQKDLEQVSLAYQFNNQVNINAINTPFYEDSSNSNNLRIDYESDANSKANAANKIHETENSEDVKKNKKADDKKSSHKSSHRSRDSHRHSSSKYKKTDSKQSRSRDGSRHDKKHKSDHSKSKSYHKEGDRPKDKSERKDSSEKKDNSDRKDSRDSSKHRSSNRSSSSQKDSKSNRSASCNQKSNSKPSDDKKSSSTQRDKMERSSDKNRDKKDYKRGSRDSKSSHRSEKDKKMGGKSKHDSKDKKRSKKETDDHYSLSGRGNSNRRSTDRDSNDGSSSSKGSNNPRSSKAAESKKESKETSSKSDNTTSSDTTSPSDKEHKVTSAGNDNNNVPTVKPIVRVETQLEVPTTAPPRLPFVPDVTLKKPKFAANLAEAKKMIKMRKFLDEEQKRMNQEAALLLEFQANVRPSLSQAYSSISGPELEFACVTNLSQTPIENQGKYEILQVSNPEDHNDEFQDHTQDMITEENPSEAGNASNINDKIEGACLNNENIDKRFVRTDIEDRVIEECEGTNHSDSNSIDPSVDVNDSDTDTQQLNEKKVETYEENKPFAQLVEEITEYSKASERMKLTDKPSTDANEITNRSDLFEVTIITEEMSENEDIDEANIQTKITKEVLRECPDEEFLHYFDETEKYDAELKKHVYSSFLKTINETLTEKKNMYLVNCNSYEENIFRDVCQNFGQYEIVNYMKNGHLKFPNAKNVKNFDLDSEIVLPVDKGSLASVSRPAAVFSPIKSECSFDLSSDYDARLEEMVNKTSKQEVMEIILGGVINESPDTMPTIDYCTESNIIGEISLKRKANDLEIPVNNNRHVLTQNKIRKLSGSDQISSTTEETDETSNNNKIPVNTRSKYLGRAKRVGLPKPRKPTQPNSPSSDKSVENYEQNSIVQSPNGKLRTPQRTKIQRYDTSDLYKPKLHYLSRRNNIS